MWTGFVQRIATVADAFLAALEGAGVPVTGTVTATVDTSALATGAKQDTLNNSVKPSPKFREYSLATIGGGDQNLVSIGGAACRRIKVIGAGSLVLTPTSPISGDETLTVSDGDVLDVQANVIKSSTSGLTAVQVFW